jgi:hypothetical protein
VPRSYRPNRNWEEWRNLKVCWPSWQTLRRKTVRGSLQGPEQILRATQEAWNHFTFEDLQNVFKLWMERLTWGIANNGEYCHQNNRLESHLIWGLWHAPWSGTFSPLSISNPKNRALKLADYVVWARMKGAYWLTFGNLIGSGNAMRINEWALNRFQKDRITPKLENRRLSHRGINDDIAWTAT